MNGRTFMRYVAGPAVIGAAVGFVANQMGYDINATEGARQSVLACMPWIFARVKKPDEGTLRSAANNPTSYPILSAASIAAVYSVGCLGMEVLTKSDLSNGFVAVVGALEGTAIGARRVIRGIRSLRNQRTIDSIF